VLARSVAAALGAALCLGWTWGHLSPDPLEIPAMDCTIVGLSAGLRAESFGSGASTHFTLTGATSRLVVWQRHLELGPISLLWRSEDMTDILAGGPVPIHRPAKQVRRAPRSSGSTLWGRCGLLPQTPVAPNKIDPETRSLKESR
jgi:hypothetical protein